MIMGSHFDGSDVTLGSQFDCGVVLGNSNEISNGFRFSDHSPGFNSMKFPFVYSLGSSSSAYSGSSLSTEREVDPSSPSDDSDFSDSVLKYISQVLMEEDMEEKPVLFHDALALQAAEKSLFEALSDQSLENPKSCSSGIFSDCSSSAIFSSTYSNPWQSSGVGKNGGRPSLLQTAIPENFIFQSTRKPNLESPVIAHNGFAKVGNQLVGSYMSELLHSNYFGDGELESQFKRGLEEASKFLPNSSQLGFDLVAQKRDSRYNFPSRLTGKKNHEREFEDSEGRTSKQSAAYMDESELAELFDRALLCHDEENEQPPSYVLHPTFQNRCDESLQNENASKSRCGKTRGKRQGSKTEAVDLRTLLFLCAQAVSADDGRTCNELLRQIRQHSSRFGDGSQRLAHFFADALEARLSGTGSRICGELPFKGTSVADILKAHKLYTEACPFLKFAIMFANGIILELAEKATTLHIIDFGIYYGFPWPALINHLSHRSSGPPKLRITGIEFPQNGFRPAELVQETGRRLARYCQRFGLQFEYNAIAQNWENIQMEDLKINPDEMLIVHSLCRFSNLLDETVAVNSPRDSVLRLIRKANPDMFVQTIINGSFNTPFFVSRFREALFHFSAYFDMCDTIIPRDDRLRLILEKEFYGRDIMNVVACEGAERVERPETYKQWQVRNRRAGFRHQPLDPQLVKCFGSQIKQTYHNEFVVDADGEWMLQGWKGRIMYASSLWIPAQD